MASMQKRSRTMARYQIQQSDPMGYVLHLRRRASCRPRDPPWLEVQR